MKQIITRNPEILGGKPIIDGTRMSVESVLELLAGGMEIKEILKEYPFLKKSHILAAIEYAAELTGNKKAYGSPKISAEDFRPIPHEIHRRR
ncbi:MAG: hypothetical protein CEO21_233 [Microgenomates group bacterium Gr01-1014_80]|nr:MAG: hypothetical protein CEO21_233 [Microgenomates group bacterium Gr01-1014_80]